MSGLPDHVAAEIHEHLGAIAALFKPGAKLTLLIRNDFGPGVDADVVITNDSLPEAIAGLKRRQAIEAGK
jgi:hypothetical protein